MLSLHDVAHTYRAAKEPSLREVSLSVGRGEMVGIVGANGAGKSTLLRVMASLLEPSAGSVRLEGADVRGLSRGQIARSIAWVAQAERVPDELTARESVSLGRAPHTAWHGSLSTRDRAVVDRAMERCGVSALAERPVASLSGGEQRRVSLARALAQQCPLVLLDEPTASLDVPRALSVLKAVRASVDEGEFAAVMVLHDVALAARLCTRVLLMHKGQVVADGAPREVLTDDALSGALEGPLRLRYDDATGISYLLALDGA